MSDDQDQKFTFKSARDRLFCHEYVVDFNGAAAARRAGFSARRAAVTASEKLANPKIRAYVDHLAAERVKQADIDADEIMSVLAAIIRTDFNDIMQLRVAACRYCHGTDHEYQWRDQDEFNAAVEEWQAAQTDEKKRSKFPDLPPDETGGYGYTRRLPPVETCPKCDGFGVPFTVLCDTTKLGPEARIAYEGIKQTQHGIEIKVANRMDAIERVGKNLGMWKGEVAEIADGFAQMLGHISQVGSRAPMGECDPKTMLPPGVTIVSDQDEDDEDEIEP